MADDLDENPNSTANGDSQEAQKDLDDLTVLSNIGAQDMGAARLNTVRPADVADGALGTLATIHQGSQSAPAVQDGFDVETGQLDNGTVGIEVGEAAPEVAVAAIPEIAELEDAPAPEPDTAPRLNGQDDLYGGNIIFGAPIETVAEVPDAAPQAVVEPLEVDIPVEQVVPAASEEEPHVDQLPVFGGIVIDPNPFDDDPSLVPVPSPVPWYEDQVLVFGINATDPDGGQISISFEQPAHGVVTVNADGTYSYTPTQDYFGQDSFTVIITDDEGNQVSQVIQINLANEDDAAVVTISGGTGAESNTDQATQVTGAISATDVDGAITGYEVVGDDGETHHGTLSVDPATGEFTFTAEDNNWHGTDTFTVKIYDEQGGVTEVPVTITVTATDEIITSGGLVVGEDGAPTTEILVTEDTPLTFGVDVSSSGGDDTTSISFDTPAHGTITVNDDGSYTYTPDPDYFGGDTITYTVTDSEGGQITQTVTVTVEGVDDATVVTGSVDLNQAAMGGSGTEDVSHFISTESLLSNASDVDSTLHVDNLKAVDADGNIVGTFTAAVVDGVDGYVFTPAENFNGDVTITYDVVTEDGMVTPDSASLTLAAVNDGPVALDLDLGSVAEDGSVFISQSSLASDVDGDSLSFSDLTAKDAAGNIVGTLTPAVVDGVEGFTFTPNENYNGDDVQIGYTVSDGTESVSGTATIDVTAVNDGPVVLDPDLGAVAEDGSVFISQASLASDVDGDTLSFSDLTAKDAAGNIVGTLTPAVVDGVEGFTFTPNENYNGADVQIGYTVSDGTESVSGTATIDVTAVNDGPVALSPDLGSVAEDGSVFISQSSLASDVDGDSLSFSDLTAKDAAGNIVGTLTPAMVDGVAGFTFTPNENYNGDDVQIGYTVSDGTESVSGTATIDVTAVNDGPVALSPDLGAVAEDGSVFISQSSLASDVDGDSLSFSDLTAKDAAGNIVGTLTPAVVDGVEGFTFTPNENYNGDDVQIGYTVSDGTESVSGTATIDVTAVNDGPVALSPDLGSVAEDGSVFISQSSLASDVDGDTLTFSDLTAKDAAGNIVGTLTPAMVDGVAGFTFTPNENYNGADVQIGYTVSDGTESVSGTATIDVTAVNDGPVALSPDLGSVAEDGSVFISQASLASDVDGDSLSFSDLTAKDAAGNIVGTLTPAVVDGVEGFTFTPNENYNGDDVQIGYTVSDGTESVSGTATIDVTAVNDGPVALDPDLGSVAEDGSVFISQSSLASDVDGDTLSFSDLTAKDAAGNIVGTLTPAVVEGVAGFTFTPNENYNGDDVQIGYTVSDGTESVSGTATIDVTAVNDGPVIETGLVATDEDQAVSGRIAASDVDGDTLTFGLAEDGGPAHGTLTLNEDGTFTYTPEANYKGEDSFTVTVDDGQGGVTTKVIGIEVAPDADGVVFTTSDVVIDLSSGDDTLTGTDGADTLVGGGGNDVIDGGAGDDVIYGDASASSSGSYTVGLDIDVTRLDASESLSAITIGGLPGGASLSAGSRNEDGTWTVSVDDLPGLELTVTQATGSGFTLSLSATSTDGTDSVVSEGSLTVSFEGNAAGDDTLSGGAGNDTLYGGGGDDVLTGGAGADVLDGGAGNDVFQMTGEDGTWGASYATSESAFLYGKNLNADTFIGGDGIDTLNGTSGNDVILAQQGGGKTVLSGIEVINAGDGNDVVDMTNGWANYGATTIDGGAGNDVLFGQNGDDTLIGGTGNDTLNGAGGADLVLGGDGNDLVVAKGGETAGDVLDGGAGTDTLKVRLSASEYTEEVRAELIEFRDFIADPANAGQTFTFETLDGLQATSFENLTVVIGNSNLPINLNSPPTTSEVALADGAEDSAVTFAVSDLLTNANDADGDAMSVSNISADHGTVEVHDGVVTFTPEANYHGEVTFSYTITDTYGASTTGSASLDLASVNDGPTVSGTVDLGDGTEDVALIISKEDLLANATDVDGDTLSIADISADHGTLVDNGDGTYTFTPETDYAGEVTFSYTVDDGNGDTVAASATLDLADVIDNVNPEANDDSAIDTIAQAAALSVDISDATITTTTSAPQWNSGAASANDPGDWSGVAAMSNPASSPTQSYSGWINGASGTSGSDSVYVNGGLNGAVTLGSGDDALYVTGGSNSGGNISAGDGNDTVRIDGDAQTITLGTGDDKLQLGGSMKGGIDAGSGDDQVKLMGTADRQIILGDGNDQLDVAASLNSTASVDAGAGDDLVKIGGDINASVGLGDGDDYLKVGGNQNSNATIDAGAGDDVVKITGDANSKTSLGDGDDYLKVGGQVNSGATIDAGAGDDVVRLGKDINGKILLGDGDDTLTSSGYINSSGTISAGAGNDYVEVGTTGQWNSGGTVDMGGDDDMLVYKGHIQTTLVGGDGDDLLVLKDYTLADWNNNVDNIQNSIGDGKLISGFEKIVLGDGTVLFDNTSGSETSTYSYTVTITATPNDDDGSETLSALTVANIPAGAVVMLGDTELQANADGSYTIPVDAAGGSLALTITSASALDLSGITTSVSSTEENGGQVQVTTVVGEGTETGDVAVDETIATDENSALTLKAADLLANDTDADGDTLTIASVGNATHGTVALDADGNVVFTPDEGYSGTATFEYTVSDGQGGTDTATVTVRVDNTNDAPVVTAVTGGTGEESTTDAATVVTGSIVASDSDNDTLSYALTDGGSPANGVVQINADGSYVYTANDSNWSGTDTFTVTVSDGQGGTITQAVTITVTPEADTPTLQVAAEIVGNGITVTNMGHEEASYRNTYGYYILDENGNPSSGQIIWCNVKESIGDSFTISGVNPEQVGFFLIPDGAGYNAGKIVDGEAVSFIKDSNGNWQVVDSQGNHLTGASGANVLFDDADLNPGNVVAAEDNTDALGNQNWEDLTSGSDGDYDDANFNVQNATIGAGTNDTLSGNIWNNTLKGMAGDDTIYGNGGNDVLYGDDSTSTGTHISGGYVYADLDLEYGSPDAGETFSFTVGGLPAGVVLLVDGVEIAAVNGVYELTEAQVADLQLKIPESLSGTTLDFDIAVTSHDGSSTATTSTSAEILIPALAGDGNDYLDGGSGNDTLYGGGGNDFLLGGSGNDTIYGGDGNDILNGGTGTDTLDGGSGNDTFVFSGEQTGFTMDGHYYSTAEDQGGANGSGGTGKEVDISNLQSTTDTFIGGDGIDTLQMTDGNDFIHISNVSSIERINAGAGNDVIDMNYSDGGAYNSFTLDGGSGNDTVFANNGDDYLMGGSGNDFMSGNAGNDTLDGGIGNDTLYGGSGDDILIGGAGDDKMYGGDGNDTFLFDFGDGHDTISGGSGSAWTDTLDLSQLGDGVTVDIHVDGWGNGTNWTVSTDNVEGITDLGNDKSGSVVIHHADGSSDQVDFSSLEQIKW